MKKLCFSVFLIAAPVFATSYQVSILPSSSNNDKKAFQDSILAYLRSKYPYATYSPSSTGLWKVTVPNAPLPPAPPLFLDSFAYPDGLLTNEWAYWNPGSALALKSSNWEMTSGSLYAKDAMAWSGVPNDKAPDATSSAGNNSSVFRVNTYRRDFKDVSVSFNLKNMGYVSSAGTPAVDWDGVHVFLRYQSQYSLYYASINRRDGKCVIKKKVPGGPSNGGTYYDISPYVSHPFVFGTNQNVKATVKNNVDGSVTISLYAEGLLIVQATDNGSIGGPAITNAGATGIRGDNCQFFFDDFKVEAL